jgi:hypothetical protein
VSDLYLLISGAIVMGCWAIGLFFLGFWRRTGERLFLWFAGAFWLLAAERCVGPLFHVASEDFLGSYVARLAAFVTILVAIADKNRAASRPLRDGSPPRQDG